MFLKQPIVWKTYKFNLDSIRRGAGVIKCFALIFDCDTLFIKYFVSIFSILMIIAAVENAVM